VGAAVSGRQAAVAVLALLALACLPGSAAADGGHGRSAGKQWLGIELEGSDGYAVHVSVDPRQHLILKVSKDGFSAEYLTRDLLAASNLVKANLRGLGVVSVRFHPRGPARHPSVPGCAGKQPVVQPGVARGMIRFAGERHYTEVETREAPAAVERPKSGFCRYAEPFDPYPHDREWISNLSAGGAGAFFLARKYRPGLIEGGDVLYWAETGETFEATAGHPWLAIYRQLRLPADVSTFHDTHPEHLSVSPPSPFSGTGALARTPESVFTWEGDLAVQFPGLDPIPLAGPGFAPDLCIRETGCIRQQGY
jgi:hypothetical protein